MKEYIEREAALKWQVPHFSANGVEIIEGKAIPVEFIENLPAADVEEVLTMRLIDATPEVCEPYLYDHLDDLHMIAAQNAIDDMPTVDAVPVVRCKDCRHRDPEDHKCESGEMERQGCPFPVDDDYYCSYGERKGGKQQ